MFEVRAERRQNRLLLDLTGRMEREELDEAAKETVETAEKLREEFDIINDLTGFRPPSPEAAKAIKQAQRDLVEMGVDRVVRVVDDETSEVVVNAFERRSRDVGYSGETARSLEEAERLLEEENIAGYAHSDD